MAEAVADMAVVAAADVAEEVGEVWAEYVAVEVWAAGVEEVFTVAGVEEVFTVAGAYGAAVVIDGLGTMVMADTGTMITATGLCTTLITTDTIRMTTMITVRLMFTATPFSCPRVPTRRHCRALRPIPTPFASAM